MFQKINMDKLTSTIKHTNINIEVLRLEKISFLLFNVNRIITLCIFFLSYVNFFQRDHYSTTLTLS